MNLEQLMIRVMAVEAKRSDFVKKRRRKFVISSAMAMIIEKNIGGWNYFIMFYEVRTFLVFSTLFSIQK